MRTWPTASWLPILGLVCACGGPAEPAAAPETEAVAPSESASEAPAADAPAAGDASEAASAGPAAEEDVSAVLQLVVDDPELDSHLHLGEPGRFPLQVSGEALPSGLKLVKATEPVKVVDGPKSKKDPVLVFTEISVSGSAATVRYRYDIEGIRGTATLSKTPHGWELKNSRLVEH
jgi:hypothetical protein